MQEKLSLIVDLKDSNDQKKILDDFSQKQNQSLEAFRSQFEFIDDGNIFLIINHSPFLTFLMTVCMKVSGRLQIKTVLIPSETVM
jgi:hypothetical protein